MAPNVVVVTILALGLVISATASPEQVHTAFAGVDGVSIMWFTAASTTTSTVRWGNSSGVLDQIAQGTSVSYGADMGYHHTVPLGFICFICCILFCCLIDGLSVDAFQVVLSGLGPEALIFYQCGDANDGWTAVFSVNTVHPHR